LWNNFGRNLNPKARLGLVDDQIEGARGWQGAKKSGRQLLSNGKRELWTDPISLGQMLTPILPFVHLYYRYEYRCFGFASKPDAHITKRFEAPKRLRIESTVRLERLLMTLLSS
jgi:hypothetical protein